MRWAVVVGLWFTLILTFIQPIYFWTRTGDWMIARGQLSPDPYRRLPSVQQCVEQRRLWGGLISTASDRKIDEVKASMSCHLRLTQPWYGELRQRVCLNAGVNDLYKHKLSMDAYTKHLYGKERTDRVFRPLSFLGLHSKFLAWRTDLSAPLQKKDRSSNAISLGKGNVMRRLFRDV